MIRRLALWAMRRLRGDPIEQLVRRGLVMGRDVSIQRGAVIDAAAPWLIEIGDHTTIAPGAYLLVHDASTKRHIDRTRVGRVRIGRRVFIGARSLILPGVSIGDDAIVAAGSVVTRDVEAGSIVAGNPARFVRTVAEYIAEQERCLAAGPFFPPAEYPMDDLDAIAPQQRAAMRAALADGRRGFVV